MNTARPEHAMTMTGFCAYPSGASHSYCAATGISCTCQCHAGAGAG